MRPQIARLLRLAPGPCGRAEVFGGALAGDIAHQLYPQHHGQAVAPGLDLGAGGLVASSRNPGQIGMDMAEEAAQRTLPGEKLGHEIADVGNLHLARLDPGGGKRGFGHVAEQVEHPAAFAVDIAREIGLRSAQHEHICGHGQLSCCSIVSAASRTSLRMTLPVTLRGRAVKRTSRSGSLNTARSACRR